MVKKKDYLMNGNKTNKGQGFNNRPENINKNGRPRKLVSDVLVNMKKQGIKPVSMDEIKDIYLSLVNHNKEDLQELLKDDKQPILTKLVIQAMMKGKGLDILEKMFDRALGKAQQTITHEERTISEPTKKDIKKYIK